MREHALRTAVILLGISAAVIAVAARADGSDDALAQQMQDNLQHPCKQMDTPQWKEVRAVVLTLPMIKNVNATDVDIEALKQADPGIGSQLAEIGLDTLGDTTFDKEVASYQAIPSVAAAIAKHRLTVRQYLADKMALLTTMMVAMGVPSMYTLDQLKQQDCDVKNVQFFIAHNDEIGKLLQPPP